MARPRAGGSRPAQKKANTAKKKPAGPGIGGGARGQRLAAGAAAYRSPNIAGDQVGGYGFTPGGYDQGTTLEKIARNEYLNTLSLEDRQRYMNQTGYFTGGVPTATPKTSSLPKGYLKQLGLAPGEKFVYESSPGVTAGIVENVDGRNVYNPLREGRGGTAKRRSTKRESGALRGRDEGRKPRRGGRKGGDGGAQMSGAEAKEALGSGYAEADVTTTSYLRAQGKAYAASKARMGGYLEGQTYAPESATEESAVAGGGKKGSRAKRVRAKAKKKSSPGGTKVTAKERARIQRAKKK